MLPNPRPLPPPRKFAKTCTRCRRQMMVIRTVARYESGCHYDGEDHVFVVEDLTVPTCAACGERSLDHEALEQLAAAECRHLGILGAREIRAGREAAGLSPAEMARLLAVPEPTYARWENGWQLPRRREDRLLRAFFALPELRACLRRLADDPGLNPRPAAELGAYI